MKVTRPPHARPASPGKTPAIGGTKGKAFAAKLERSGRAAPPTGAERTAPAHRTTAVADIGTELKAGKISAQAAVDRVVERVLDRQLGKMAPAALRAKVGAALRDSLADDPVLAAKVRAVSQE